jgi:hypothetical protein
MLRLEALGTILNQPIFMLSVLLGSMDGFCDQQLELEHSIQLSQYLGIASLNKTNQYLVLFLPFQLSLDPRR